MRVTIRGDGGTADVGRVAAALALGGFTIAGDDMPYDAVLTLGGAAATTASGAEERIGIGDIVVDPGRRRAWRGGRAVRLTPIEFDLLVRLARAPAPMGRTALLQAVWGYAADPGTNLVAVHLSRLRAKLGPGAVVRDAAGYRLAAAGGEPAMLVGATGFEPATPRPPV